MTRQFFPSCGSGRHGGIGESGAGVFALACGLQRSEMSRCAMNGNGPVD
jgi:hypothetical protein